MIKKSKHYVRENSKMHNTSLPFFIEPHAVLFPNVL